MRVKESRSDISQGVGVVWARALCWLCRQAPTDLKPGKSCSFAADKRSCVFARPILVHSGLESHVAKLDEVVACIKSPKRVKGSVAEDV